MLVQLIKQAKYGVFYVFFDYRRCNIMCNVYEHIKSNIKLNEVANFFETVTRSATFSTFLCVTYHMICIWSKWMVHRRCEQSANTIAIMQQIMQNKSFTKTSYD